MNPSFVVAVWLLTNRSPGSILHESTDQYVFVGCEAAASVP